MVHDGHQKLKNRDYDISHIKYTSMETLKKGCILIVDEAQRLFKDQLKQILDGVNKSEIQVIFS